MVNEFPLVFPLLVSMGSGYENLDNDLTKMKNALMNARTQLYEGMPHNRDYYVLDDCQHQGPNYKKAREQHQRRIELISDMIDELQSIHENIADQRKEQKKRFNNQA